MPYKYVQIAKLLERRIKKGDYSFSSLIGAPKLAKETGCSYLTARQAIQKLVNDQVLHKLPSGRLQINNSHMYAKGALKVVHIRPSWQFSIWDHSIYQVSKQFNCSFQTALYTHDDDPVIFNAIDGDFDLIFMSANTVGPLLAEKLARNKDRIVMMFHDMTHLGIRCLDGAAPSSIQGMMEYLVELGHREIACFNTQTLNLNIKERIKHWELGKKRFSVGGQLYSYPVQNFGFTADAAYKTMNRLLEAKFFQATAVFCTTTDVAAAILRSFHEFGIQVPKDVSVCSFGEVQKARLAIPSITVIDAPDYLREVRAVFEYFSGQGGDAKKLLCSSRGKLYLGESTAPAPKVSNISKTRGGE